MLESGKLAIFTDDVSLIVGNQWLTNFPMTLNYMNVIISGQILTLAL